MAAEDHLGQQFEVMQQHRSVRVGDRTYPAVFTSHPDESYHHAVIPSENGGLWSVGGFANDNHMSINAPKYSMTAPEERHSIANRDLFSEVGSAHGVQDFHNSMRALSSHKLDPDAAANNRRLMGEHQRVVNLKDG